MADRKVPAASAEAVTMRAGKHRPGSRRGAQAWKSHASGDGDLALNLLGGFALIRAGKEFATPTSAQRLIAFLALQERPVHRLYVAGNLWRDVSESHSNASLRTALWRLHRLGVAIVDPQSDHLALRDEVRVDIREVAACARETLESDETPAGPVVKALCRAGELLPDWYEDWLVNERETLRQLRLHALEAACRQLAACGRMGQALEAGLAAVAAEPLRESAQCALIGVYLAEGNRSEALRQYEFFRRLLHERLGVEPSPRIRELIASASTR
jgi:DNA-binding SARP family transcriptional activator